MGAVVLIPIKLFGSDTNLAVGRSPRDIMMTRVLHRPAPLVTGPLLSSPERFLLLSFGRPKRNPNVLIRRTNGRHGAAPFVPRASTDFSVVSQFLPSAVSRCPQILGPIRHRESDHPLDHPVIDLSHRTTRLSRTPTKSRRSTEKCPLIFEMILPRRNFVVYLSLRVCRYRWCFIRHFTIHDAQHFSFVLGKLFLIAAIPSGTPAKL